MQPTVRKLIFSSILTLATLATASFFWDKPITATVILAGLSALMLFVEWKKQNLILYLFIFILGPVVEAIAIYFGAWSYTHPFIIGIPLWLPFVWGNCSLYIIRVKALIDLF